MSEQRQTRSQTAHAQEAARQFSEQAQQRLQQPVLLPHFTNFTLGSFRDVSQFDNYAHHLNSVLAQTRAEYLSSTQPFQNQMHEPPFDSSAVSQARVDPTGIAHSFPPAPGGPNPLGQETHMPSYQSQINELSRVLERASEVAQNGTVIQPPDLSAVHEGSGDVNGNVSIPPQGDNRHINDLHTRVTPNNSPTDPLRHISNPIDASSPTVPTVTLQHQPPVPQPSQNPYSAQLPFNPTTTMHGQPRINLQPNPAAPDMYNFFEVDERFRSYIPENPETRPRDSTNLGGSISHVNLQSSMNFQPHAPHLNVTQTIGRPSGPHPVHLQPLNRPPIPTTGPIPIFQQPTGPMPIFQQPTGPMPIFQQPTGPIPIFQQPPNINSGSGLQSQALNQVPSFQPQHFNQSPILQPQYVPSRPNFQQNQNFPNQNQMPLQQPYAQFPQGPLAGNGNSNMLMNMNMPDIKLDHFSGLTEDYPDFKALFQTITALYPENVKAHVLKSHLDEDSKRRVAHVFLSDPNALASMWSVLDRKHQQEYQSPHFHTSKLMGLLASKPCTNLKDLQTLYDKVLFHYSRVCSAGPEYVGQAEAVKNGIASLLFGTSRKKVNQLLLPKSKHKFNMKRVLDIIEEHIQELEIDNLSESTRKIMHQDTRYNKGTYSSPDYPPNSYSPKFSRENLGSYRTDSRNRSQSPAARNYYPNSRSPRSNRDYYSSSRPSRSPTKSSDPHAYHIESSEASINLNVGKPSVPPSTLPNSVSTKGERQRSTSPNSRSNVQDQTPVRGARTASRSPRPRRRESYKCTLCAVDDHQSLSCKRHQSADAMKLAREYHLCYKCLVPDHLSSNCPFPNHCTSSDCKSIPHNTIFCNALKR